MLCVMRNVGQSEQNKKRSLTKVSDLVSMLQKRYLLKEVINLQIVIVHMNKTQKKALVFLVVVLFRFFVDFLKINDR